MLLFSLHFLHEHNNEQNVGKKLFIMYLIFVLHPHSPFLIWVSFDLYDIFNITINIKQFKDCMIMVGGGGGLFAWGGGGFSHFPTYQIYIYILLLFGIIASFALSVLIVFMHCPFIKHLIWCFICNLLLLNIHMIYHGFL